MGHHLVQPKDLDRREFLGQLVGKERKRTAEVPHVKERDLVESFNLKGCLVLNGEHSGCKARTNERQPSFSSSPPISHSELTLNAESPGGRAIAKERKSCLVNTLNLVVAPNTSNEGNCLSKSQSGSRDVHSWGQRWISSALNFLPRRKCDMDRNWDSSIPTSGCHPR